jgi:hypothetical protein
VGKTSVVKLTHSLKYQMSIEKKQDEVRSYLENLAEKVDCLSNSLKPRFVPLTQKGQYKNRGVVIVGYIEDVVDIRGVIPGLRARDGSTRANGTVDLEPICRVTTSLQHDGEIIKNADSVHDMVLMDSKV